MLLIGFLCHLPKEDSKVALPLEILIFLLFISLSCGTS